MKADGIRPGDENTALPEVCTQAAVVKLVEELQIRTAE